MNNSIDDNNDSIVLNKLDIISLNQGWNDNNEKFIVNIGENASLYKEMHDKTSKQYIIYDNILKILLAILGTLVSADSFINLFQSSDVLNVLQKTLTFILAVITIIFNFVKYSELYVKHKHAANAFGVLYHDIQNVMCLYRKDRPYAVKYIQHCIKEYDKLEVSGPSIPLSTIKKYNLTKNNIEHVDIVTTNDIETNSNLVMNNKSNLSQIKDHYKIDGDIYDNDTITINIQNLKKKGLISESDYEINRFMSHN